MWTACKAHNIWIPIQLKGLEPWESCAVIYVSEPQVVTFLRAYPGPHVDLDVVLYRLKLFQNKTDVHAKIDTSMTTIAIYSSL